MQPIARIMTANPAAHQLVERAAEIPSIAPGNESEYECSGCKDSGWRWVDLPGRAGMRKCECVAEKARAQYLALIPERFKDGSFESFKPCNPQHSFLSGWRLQRIPGEIVRICRRRIRIRVWLRGAERLVNVDPENLLWDAVRTNSRRHLSSWEIASTH